MEIIEEMQVPQAWKSVFSCLFEESEQDTLLSQFSQISKIDVSHARVAVLGGKGVGKSTFNKWLVNRMLENMADTSSEGTEPFLLYIDLDPGQPEFTPPGVISVLKITETTEGPNYSHLQLPILSKYLGSLNMSDCVRLYLECAKEIFSYLNSDENFANVPWIINTMGFCRGLGVTLACKLICLFNPNVVIQIMVDGIPGEEKRSYPFLLTVDSVRFVLNNDKHRKDGIDVAALKSYQFVPIDSVFCDLMKSNRKKIWGASPKLFRDKLLTSYFREITQNTDDNKITAVPPRMVPLSSITLATMINSLSYKDVLRAINGNLIALCNISFPFPPSNEEGKVVSGASRYSNTFLGYGIVRSIDRRNGALYIITPVAEDVLVDQVNCIVPAGSIGFPIQLYLQAISSEDGCVDLPYVMSKQSSKSKLNQAAKKQFVPKRVAHAALTNSLL